MDLENDYLKPGLASILKKLELNKHFTRAKGNYLYYLDSQNQEVEVIDFVGGYGSLILGHNHPVFVDYAIELLRKNIPIHSQLSHKSISSALGKKISDSIAKYTDEQYVCTLTNSGTETVEAAFKHARMKKIKEINAFIDSVNIKLNRIDNETLKEQVLGFKSEHINNIAELKKYITETNRKSLALIKPRILSSKNGFHGKTLGSLKATYNSKYREKILFDTEKDDVLFFDWETNNVDNLIEECSFTLVVPELDASGLVSVKEVKLNSCIAVIIEPILGEGGVIMVPDSFLLSLRKSTLKYGIPLILDEIQTGIYRTGLFLNSLKLTIKADYYLVGKSLGGGIVKIGALMIDKKHYDDDFCLLHSSTFAEDEYSSAIALKVLELAEAESIHIADKSSEIREKLELVVANSNSIIKSILGEGLMIGIKFKSYHDSACMPLQFISNSGYFNYFVASYLLNNFNVRIAPTLSDEFTIRIQPSLTIETKDIDQLVKGLLQLCKVLESEDLYYLIKHFLPLEYRNLRPLQKFINGTINFEKTSSFKVGFLCHFIDVENAIESDSSISMLPKTIIEDFLLDLIELKSSLIIGNTLIESESSGKVEFVAIGLPFTSNMVKDSIKNGNINLYRDICHKAIADLKKKYDIDIIGLGQYTSILTYNGTLIPQIDLSITTGNSYTVYIGIQSVLSSISSDSLERADVKIGIVGAAGNISSVFAKCFSSYASKIYLKGSDSQNGYNMAKESANSLISYILGRLLNRKEEKESVLEKQIRETRLYSRIRTGIIEIDDQSLYEQLILELGDFSPIIVCDSIAFLKKCELVVLATNNPDAIFSSRDFNNETIIYDISVPQNVLKNDLMTERNIQVIEGGIVKLPNEQFLPFQHFPLEKGTAFACMAETMILGLEQYKGNFSFGDITPEMVYHIGEMGKKHGFSFFKNKEVAIFK